MPLPPRTRNPPMPPSDARRRTSSGTQLPPETEGVGGLRLHGDLSNLKDAFTCRAKHSVTCPMTESIRQRLEGHPRGVSGFLEEAVSTFDGDLPALVRAAVTFCENRRDRMPEDHISNVSARLLPETFAKIATITTALKGVPVRGASRAKVVAGLIQLQLNHSAR